MSGFNDEYRVRQKLINPLKGIYKDPAPAFEARLAVELAGFSDYQLGRGAAHILRTHRYQNFPSIPECLEACEQYPREAPPPPSGDFDPAVLAQREIARQQTAAKGLAALKASSLKHEARRDDWLPALLEFCKEHGRLPNSVEIEKCKAQGRAAFAAVDNWRTQMAASVPTSEKPIGTWKPVGATMPYDEVFSSWLVAIHQRAVDEVFEGVQQDG